MDIDMKEIKALHKEWFPVEYTDTFFEAIEKEIYKMLLAVYIYKKDGVGCSKK